MNKLKYSKITIDPIDVRIKTKRPQFPTEYIYTLAVDILNKNIMYRFQPLPIGPNVN